MAAAWSPDGTQLAIPIAGAIAKGEPRIKLLTLLSGDVRRIMTRLQGRPGPGGCLDLAWSLDGRFLACVNANSYNNQTSTLWVIRLQDESFIKLSENSYVTWSPTWAPDSRTLFFTSNRDGGTMDVWSQPLSVGGEPTGEPTRLTTGLDVQHAGADLRWKPTRVRQGATSRQCVERADRRGTTGRMVRRRAGDIRPCVRRGVRSVG